MANTRFVSTKAVVNPAAKSVSTGAVQNAISKGFVGTIFNPGIIFNPGGGTTGGSGTTPPPPTGGTTTPAAPSGPGANLLALLAAIPIAGDGQVISADYHNSLRSALIGLANQMGMGLTTPTTSYSFAPAFFPIGGTAWTVSANPNLIAASAAGANPDGWLPVHLPDGQTIQGMTVTGKLTTPAPTTFSVTLYREDVTAGGSGPTSLIAVTLQTQSGVFTQSGQITTGSAASSPAALLLQQATLQDLQLIDNSQYKYFLRATVTGAGGATVAEIDAIQILIGS